MERRWNARRSAAPTTSSRQQRQPEHRRAGDVGIRTPPPPSGTAARPSADHSASESVSQRPPEGLPTPRCTPGHPPEIRKVPVNAGSQRRRLGAGPPHRRPPGPAIGGTRVRSSRCCSDPTTAACRRPPVEFAAVAADEHRRAGDVGIRPPPPPSGTAAWPSADHSASESVSQRPPEGLPNPRVYLRAPPEIRKVPVNAGSQRRWLRAVRHTGSAWTRNRRHPRAVVGLLFRPDDRCPALVLYPT